MSAETAFVALMKATSAVTSLIGSSTRARVRADRLEQDDTLPAIAYARTNTDFATALSGDVLETKATLEVRCWANTRAQADALADAVTAAIETAQHFIVARAGGADDADDLALTVLTVDWWE